MHEQWRDLVPFYVAGTLPAGDRAAVEEHLAECAECREVLREWRLVAAAAQSETSERAIELPPLSAAVRASLRHQPSVGQSLRSMSNLVWGQRAVLVRSGLIPTVLIVLMLGVVASALMRGNAPVALPLLTLVPVAAALGVTFLHGPDTDSAFEIVSATPTQPATLVFARLTLILALVIGVGGLGSVLLSATGVGALAPLVGAWLGPMLVLSALATVLSLLWPPIVAAGTTLALWASVVALLTMELDGGGPPGVSLRPLLNPDWASFGTEVAIALLMWLIAWVLLARDRTSLGRLGIGG